MYNPINRIAVSIVLIVILLPLAGCFTGIESTKKITLSREDRRQTAPTPEERYLESVVPTPHTAWESGKPFYVADERASIMMDAASIVSGRYSLEAGDTLRFREARNVRTPDGTTRVTLIFSRGDDEFRYMARDAAPDEVSIMSDALPGVIDPAMVEQVASLLTGNRYWTLSTLWLDPDGKRREGLKFDPVTVESVTEGTMVFPLRVTFRDAEGREGIYLMNFGNGGTDSRGFSNLFSLTDPRLTYPGITDEVWGRIQRAQVAPGMTKTECRLAKGNPSDVYDGHDYSRLLLLWVYPDATTLYFEDDILVNVKGY